MNLFVLAALLSVPCLAWWDNGHMMTAQIARLDLGERDAAILDGILSDWNSDFPELGDIVAAAVWPDVIKCDSVSSFCRKPDPDAINEFDDFHFDDKPYNPDHLDLSPVITDTWFNNPSASWFLTKAMRTFQKSQTRFAFNYMTRMVLHIIGDIHQPLHAISGYFNDPEFGYLPEGDRGGNLIKIITPFPGVTALHSMWDSAGGLYVNNWPLSDSQKADLKANATRIMTTYGKSSDAFNGTYNSSALADCWKGHRPTYCADTFKLWVEESYEVAIHKAYEGITQNATVSEEYINQTRTVCEIRMALGGYRLADLLRVVISRAKDLPARASGASHGNPSPWELNDLAKVELVFIVLMVGLFVTIVVVNKRRSRRRTRIGLLD